MALHTRQQAPREGQAEAKKQEQTPVQTWQPGRADYLQFLVDSQHVYATMEELVATTPEFATFRDSGLERSEPLKRDIAWFATEGVEAPKVAPQGAGYASMLREMVADGELEKFVCHFYNFYFAHTAGGRMIGKRMGAMLLDGKTLAFYAWEKDGESVDPSEELLPALRGKTVYRTIFFIPAVLSYVIVGFVWRLILSPTWGIAPDLLDRIGLGFLYQPWLGQTDTALSTLSLISVWQFIGIPMMLIYAALLSIPDELIEAAE